MANLTGRASSTKRVHARLDELYAIGEGPGASRPGYSAAEDAAHELVAGWMREAGLALRRDAAGNLYGGAGDLWCGSHLDTVPNGGRFDGALGVVAALEIVRPGVTVVAFRDEERGATGSRACVERGELPRAFVELHVEQGPVLERAGKSVGVVRAIAGQAGGTRTFEGRADHAGTTPMDARDDALVAAAEFVLRVRHAASDDAVATVGTLTVEPGAPNVVPARVTVSVDARAPSTEQLDALIASIDFDVSWRIEPVAMSDPPLAALRAAAPGAPELTSGAGHDAMILAAAGVPTGMLFVRSLNGGVSHSPDEFSSGEDIEVAMEVLGAAIERLV